MISIIICSRTATISTKLYENIKSTIGCEYELIVINNFENNYSIFEAYNIGIEKSIGKYLCFIHDDILFHTRNWGLKIKEIFKSDNKIGLIGVAGAKIKTKMPSAWWDCPENKRVVNIIQHVENNKVEKWELGWRENKIEEVAVIDGVFMVGLRNEKIKFNSENLKGFHNYDLNFSLEYYKKKYKIVVSKEIILEHFSPGIVDDKWLVSALNFDKHYRKLLPIQINKNKEELIDLELKNGSYFCNELLRNGYTKEAFYYWIKLIILQPTSKTNLHFFKLFKKRIYHKLKYNFKF